MTVGRRALVRWSACWVLGVAGCAARAPAPPAGLVPALHLPLDRPPEGAALLALEIEPPLAGAPPQATRLRVLLLPAGEAAEPVEIGQFALYPPRQGGVFMLRVPPALREKLAAGGRLRVEPLEGSGALPGGRLTVRWMPEPR